MNIDSNQQSLHVEKWISNKVSKNTNVYLLDKEGKIDKLDLHTSPDKDIAEHLSTLDIKNDVDWVYIVKNRQEELIDSMKEMIISSEEISNDSDLMWIYKKLLNSNDTMLSLAGNQEMDKIEILKRIQSESRKVSQLLANLKDGIVEWYATIESELAERKCEEPDVYSLNAKSDKNIEEQKEEEITTNIYSNNEDELDRVSEQFDGMIRLVLPAKRQTFRMKIFTIIKNFIGKDLTKFSLPIHLNEPLSLLQRMSEMAKNIRIISTATKFKDQLLRLAYIALWAATNFAGTRKRLYKPFNPLLGETFELVGSNFRWFGEQYSHHPPIGVIWIEIFSWNIHEEKYLVSRVRVNTNAKTAFWGKYVDIIVKSPVNASSLIHR